MNQKTIYPKVATDLFWVQFFWALGFLGVLLIVQIIKAILSITKGIEMNDYFDAVFIAANIFMLVIGIISSYGFLPYYVRNGVTRKDYFKGSTIASVGLSITIPIIASIISVIQVFIVNVINLSILKDSSFGNATGDEGNIVAEIILSIIFTPFVDLQSNWLLAIFVFALNIFIYYLVGWLIGSGFYRFGVLFGLFCIILAFLVIYVEDLLLSIALDLPVHDMFASVQLPIYVAVIGIFVLASLTLWMIRQLTKRVAIKM
ncbi:hypothetical protein OR571_01310 [Psychrobacillus sp. NEAU-3TGS]|uniref:hypothetical protein n=1 Tax=Psychrobacillus sp. NEAU-3TGS TaxID=2995412 RepID=UPI0024998C43|nr:hypothetical protein [Psychrobacillus sp. NEAU-3TGS]MDI2585803.1 hypothetical protein [Psychrobacillus sp. NEAU-3TGS]